MNSTAILGFTGARQDPIALTYPLGHGYRLYLPSLGRFNAPDDWSPFGRGGVNGYTYCIADPINHMDPTGHITISEFHFFDDAEEAAQHAATTVAETTPATRSTIAAQAAAGPSGALVGPVHPHLPAPFSSSSETYVPIREHLHPKFKDMGIMMVKESRLKLGRAVLTEHYSNTPPSEVQAAGGILAPNPNFPDNTIHFSNRMYDPHPNDPYVPNYLEIPGNWSNYGVGSSDYWRCVYYTVSRPDDYALGRLWSVPHTGEGRIVLRHGMVPLSDVVAVWDRWAGGLKIEAMPAFENRYEVSLPSHLRLAIEDAAQMTRL